MPGQKADEEVQSARFRRRSREGFRGRRSGALNGGGLSVRTRPMPTTLARPTTVEASAAVGKTRRIERSQGANLGRTPVMTTDVAAVDQDPDRERRSGRTLAGPGRPARGGRPRGRGVHQPGAAPAAGHPGDDRVGELRAGRRHAGTGQRADQQVRRGLPGPAVLRRLRERRRHRDAGHRADQGTVRRRFRQCATALGCAGQRRRHAGTDQARRHDPGSVVGTRRAPDPRHADQLLRAAVQRRRVRGVQGGLPDRHGRGRPGWPASTPRS